MFDPIANAVRRCNHLQLLGAPGYTLPASDDFDVIEVAAGGTTSPTPQLRVNAHSAQATATIILHRSHNLRAALSIDLYPWTRNTTLIINQNCTLKGHVAVYALQSTLILAGGVPEGGHSGQFAAQLWGANSVLYIGGGSTTNGTSFILSGDDRSILVGDDCMLAHNITLRTDDQHSIVAMDDGRRLNPANDVVVEPHVWIGQDSIVSKGVVLGLGSIVGAGSVVLRSCERFSIVAGAPSKVVATGRSWDRNPVPRPDLIERLTKLSQSVEPFVLAPAGQTI